MTARLGARPGDPMILLLLLAACAPEDTGSDEKSTGIDSALLGIYTVDA